MSELKLNKEGKAQLIPQAIVFDGINETMMSQRSHRSGESNNSRRSRSCGSNRSFQYDVEDSMHYGKKLAEVPTAK